MKKIILTLAAVCVLAGCAGNRPYAAVGASNNGVSGSIGQTFRW